MTETSCVHLGGATDRITRPNYGEPKTFNGETVRISSKRTGRFGAGLPSGDGADSEKDSVGRYGLSFCWRRFY